jgi:hypothetical protein
MKSNDTSQQSPASFPASPEEWAAVIAAAPGQDRSLTAEEAAQWESAMVVEGGGYPAVSEAINAKRKRGERGAQVSTTK